VSMIISIIVAVVTSIYYLRFTLQNDIGRL
jgi:hypothetical protein